MLKTKNSSSKFGIIGLQTDDILFLADKIFAIKKEEQLYKANLLVKKREKLNNKIIKFNNRCIRRKFNVIHLSQKKQNKNFHFITFKSMGLTSLKEKIRKMVILKN